MSFSRRRSGGVLGVSCSRRRSGGGLGVSSSRRRSGGNVVEREPREGVTQTRSLVKRTLSCAWIKPYYARRLDGGWITNGGLGLARRRQDRTCSVFCCTLRVRSVRGCPVGVCSGERGV